MDSSGKTAPRTGRRVSKAFHHKSRNGCRTCKSRRVKCDERRPTCRNCERAGKSPCIYDAPTTSPKPGPRSDSAGNAETEIIEVKNDPDSDSQLVSGLHRINTLHLPESRARRMMELRLQHNFIRYLTTPFRQPRSRPVTAWSVQIPSLALEHDNVQYLMFLCSASHLVRKVPDNREVVTARRMYRMLGLREQQKAVAKLSIENCDAVCFSAMLLLIDAYAEIWSRVTDPYTPPIEWLKIGSGVGAVLAAATKILSEHCRSSSKAALEPPPKVMLIKNAPPVLTREELFSKENLTPFLGLLDSSIELADAETREAYENALSYVGSVHYAVCNGEPIFYIARRLVSFAIFMPRKFIDLVEEGRPRALVILAHYFAVMTNAQCVWWIGNSPQKEIRAIQMAVPAEWQDLMRWPMVAAGLSPV